MAQKSETALRFETEYQRSHKYPLTLLRTDVFGHALRSLQTRLGQKGLFHPSDRALLVRDLQETATEFDKGRQLRDDDAMETLLDLEEKDPWWRFVVLLSSTSRGPLCCSKEQLAMLLTYHQVMPSFLDLVFACKSRERPLTCALFRHENYLDENLPPLSLPHLGRSGIQIQHAFNLLTVEPADDRHEKNQWPLRHATLYHSLDLKTGRAVYILLKGNTSLARRIKDATETNSYLRPGTPRTAEHSFLASLQVHLIMLEWSVEFWSEYIDSIEDTIRAGSVEARVAPVASVASPIDLAQSLHRQGSSFSPQRPPGLSRQGTTQTTASRLGAMSQGSQPASPSSEGPAGPAGPSPPASPTRRTNRTPSGFPPLNISRTFSSLLERTSWGLEGRAALAQEGGDVKEERDQLIDQLADLENRFSFNELQRLSLTGDEIDQSILALEQTKDVVSQVQEQYQTVIASHAFTTLLDGAKCKAEVDRFFRRVRSILHDMDVHRRRLKDLSRTVENDKHMFESLSQHTSIQTSKAFQLVAQTSSNQMMQWTLKMHDIAVKTKQETLSMHVITIFTLIFLPGTFIATLFSSGVLRWDEDGTLGSDWVVRGDGIRLFLSICLPLTAITISIWAFLYVIARRWARRSGKDLGLPGYADEKGIVLPAESPQQEPKNGNEKSGTGVAVVGV